MRSRHQMILAKSLDAMLAAIEVYNKPRFPYRDEAFAVLAINAWELALKARVLQLANNKLSTIFAKERRRNADGQLSTKQYLKRNRCGNPVTIGLFKAYDTIVNDFGETVPEAIRANLAALCEVRDNSVHFINESIETEITVNEIGTAATQNYLNLTRQWFGVDFSRYNLSLMPIAFMRHFRKATGVQLSAEEKNFVDCISSLFESHAGTSEFNVGLRIEVQMRRTKDGTGANFRISTDKDALPVHVDEESIRAAYPWDYNILTTQMKRRYADFKCNNEYHSVRKPLEANPKFATERFLDPGNPKSAKKTFYNPNILAEFDKHYTRAGRGANVE